MSQEFEGAVSAGGNDALKGFCDSKRGEASGGEDEETWGFLGILFEEDARRGVPQAPRLWRGTRR